MYYRMTILFQTDLKDPVASLLYTILQCWMQESTRVSAFILYLACIDLVA